MVQEGLRSIWSGECRGAGGRENPASAGTARETLPGTDRVTGSHNPAGVKDNALEGEQERKG